MSASPAAVATGRSQSQLYCPSLLLKANHCCCLLQRVRCVIALAQIAKKTSHVSQSATCAGICACQSNQQTAAQRHTK